MQDDTSRLVLIGATYDVPDNDWIRDTFMKNNIENYGEGSRVAGYEIIVRKECVDIALLLIQSSHAYQTKAIRVFLGDVASEAGHREWLAWRGECYEDLYGSD